MKSLNILGAVALSVMLCPSGVAAQSADESKKNEKASVWDVMKSHDSDGDGKVSLEEYKRGEDRFKRLDKDSDGFLTEADFSGEMNRGRRGGRGNRRSRGGMGGRMLGLMADSNQDNEVSAEEWKQLIAKVEKDGFDLSSMKLSREIPARMLDRIEAMFDTNDDGKVEVSELQELFNKADSNKDSKLSSEELGQRRGRRGGGEGRSRGASTPVAGDQAPDFTLPYLDKKKGSIKLSSYVGKKPVALIFGSYT